MRRLIACLVLACGCGWVLAAYVPFSADPPTADAVPSEEVDAFAHDVLRISGDIAMRYAKPIEQHRLVTAALSGLYDAAGLPVPPSLAADVERSVGDADPVGLLQVPTTRTLENEKALARMLEVIRRVRAGLGNPEALGGPAALLASCRGMARCLDPQSGLVSGVELLRGVGREVNYGVGLEVVPAPGPKRVQTVFPGSPAQRGGVLPGDIILQVDGRSVEGCSADEVLMALNRPAGLRDREVLPPGAVLRVNDSDADFVQLMLRRASRPDPDRVTLRREEFKPETILGVYRRPDNSWDYWLDRRRRIAHVRIATLGNDTAADLRSVLAEMQGEGLRGLILDLRWTPGGLLKSALATAGLFVKEKTVVARVRSRRDGETCTVSEEGPKVLDLPMVVLINGETSGGAELIAAALQDAGRAKVVGQRTLGKGNIQQMVPLPVRDAGFKLTTAVFLRPGGKHLHRFPDSKPTDDWGVRPDAGHEFRLSSDLSRRLRDQWLRQTLRPGSSNQALPLDDPETDPQRQAALRMLLDLLAG